MAIPKNLYPTLGYTLEINGKQLARSIQLRRWTHKTVA